MKKVFLNLVAIFLITGAAGAAEVQTSSASTVAASSDAVSLEPATIDPIPPTVSTPTIWSLLPPARAGGVIVLTLPQSIAIGLQQATVVLKARNDLEFNGTQLLQAYYQFLPDLNATADYTWSTGKVFNAFTIPTQVNTTNRAADYQLNSTLNLFNGFGDYAHLHASRERKEGSSFSLYWAKQEIILDIAQAYFQVLLDRQLVRIGEENLKASQQRETLLTQQADVGIKSLADLYRQQAETSADQFSLITARNNARNDLIFLLRRLRVDLTGSYDLADVPVENPPAEDPYADERRSLLSALQNRADLKASQSAAKASRWDVTTARDGYFPRIDAVGAITGEGEYLDKQIVSGIDVLKALPPQSSLGKQLGEQISYSAGLTLNWGLFNRYLTKLSVVQASVNAKDAQIDYQDQKLLVEGQVRQAVGDYHAVLEQLEVARKGLRYAQESYDAVVTRYGVGASSIVDVLTAQSTLVQAEASDAQAKIGFMLEKRILEYVLGETVVPKN